MSTIKRLGLALIIASLGLPVTSARATTLVNDPAQPLPAAKLAGLQRCVDRSHVPTIPGEIVISARVTEVVAGGLAGDHYIELEDRSCFALLHELAHESQMFDGLGSVAWAGQNFGAGAVGWSDEKIGTLAELLRAKPNGRLSELSADAYATCAQRGSKWSRWWGHYLPRRRGMVRWRDTSTPYNFRAGPRRYAAICTALERTS